MKVLLILADGMRPDCLPGIPFAEHMMKSAHYYPQAQTVFPSVTLPCHLSLFHSVEPGRHGTTTNVYAPQVRPVRGLCEVIRQAGKSASLYYTWEPLRDVSRPGSLSRSFFAGMPVDGYQAVIESQADLAIEALQKNPTSFTFFYIGSPDAMGHRFGWCSKEYREALVHAWQQIERIVSSLDDDFTVIITADHGGHDRMHGSDLPEDMTIPIFLYQKGIEPRVAEGGRILDLAPTVTSLLGIEPDEEWEGKPLL